MSKLWKEQTPFSHPWIILSVISVANKARKQHYTDLTVRIVKSDPWGESW